MYITFYFDFANPNPHIYYIEKTSTKPFLTGQSNNELFESGRLENSNISISNGTSTSNSNRNSDSNNYNINDNGNVNNSCTV